MRITRTIATTTVALSLMAAPALATEAAPTGDGHGKGHGRACQGLSKRHVAGQPGTPFSRCVRARAQAQAQARQDRPEDTGPTATEHGRHGA